jgi:hypothetical protein
MLYALLVPAVIFKPTKRMRGGGVRGEEGLKGIFFVLAYP